MAWRGNSTNLESEIMRKTYRKPLKPVRENNSFAVDADVPEREVVTAPADSEHITDSDTLDSYLDVAEKEKSLSMFEKDAEIDELKRKLSEAIMERDMLRTRIGKLESVSMEQDCIPPVESPNPELERRIDSLKSENARLRDTVSILENENAGLRASLKEAQAGVDRMLHSYTKPGYSAGSGVRALKNGYQDWV